LLTGFAELTEYATTAPHWESTMQHGDSPPLRQAALGPRGPGTGARATSDPTGPRTGTAPVAVEGYIGTTLSSWNELAAAGVVLVVPALLATILVQRGFVPGLTFGTVKQQGWPAPRRMQR
jgi:hypothetical protein